MYALKIYVEELIPRLSRHTNSLLERQVLWLWTHLVLTLVYLGRSLSLLYFLFVFLFYVWLHWVFMEGCGLLILVLLLLQSMSSRHMDFSSCGVWTQLLHSMWDLPGPGVKLLFPELAGEFLPTVPPGKSICLLCFWRTGFIGIVLVGSFFFLISALPVSFHSCLTCKISSEKSANGLMGFPWI